MQKQVKLMILVNAVLGIFFIIVNLVYAYFGNGPSRDVLWTPFWLTFYNTQATVDDVGVREPNFSFYFFWALLLINVYFIVKLGRANTLSRNS